MAGTLMALLGPAPAPTVALRDGLHGNITLTSGGGVSGTVAPYSPGELWGGGSELESCSFCSPSGVLSHSGGQSTDSGQDVDPITGSYTYSDGLFSVGAVAGDLGMDLTYDSGLATQEMDQAPQLVAPSFGYGWQSTFSGSISTGNNVVLTDENTAQTTFSQATTKDGCPVGDYEDIQKYTVVGSAYAYCAANRVDAQLGYFPAYGAYEMNIWGGKVVDTYGYLGHLGWVSTNAAPSSNALNFAYGLVPGQPGTPPSCAGSGVYQCFVETDDTTDRQVVALENQVGLIIDVFDPMGREYAMSYDGYSDLYAIATPSPTGSGTATTTLAYSTSAQSPYNRDLISVEDPDQHTSTISYSNGMVHQTIDPYSNTNTYTYNDSDCALPTSTDCTQGINPPQAGQQTGQVTTVAYADGEQDVDTYSQSQLVSDSYGGNGGATEPWSFAYAVPGSADQDADTIEVVNGPGGLTATIDSDATGNVTSYTDPDGNTTTSMYNDSGGSDLDELCWTAPPGVVVPANVSCSSPPVGSTYYTYDADGHELTETDPLGNTTQNGYYSVNGLLCWTAPPTVTTLGAPCTSGTNGAPSGATTHSYDIQGDVNSTTVSAAPSPAQTTTSEYNADDEVLYSIPPDGNATGPGTFGSSPYETAYTYVSGASLVATETAPLSRVTSYTYDAAGNVLVTHSPTGYTTSSYDNDERLCWSYVALSAYGSNTCASPPATGATKYSYFYDTSSPISVVDPDGYATTYAYSDTRFPTKATETTEAAVSGNPQSNIVTYDSYDSFANTCISGPTTTGSPGNCAYVSGDTVHQYNNEDQLAVSWDPSGNETTYGYGDPDFPTDTTAVRNPLGELTQYNYDQDGRMVSALDPEGQTVTTGYDADGRPCFESPFPTTANCSAIPTGPGVTALTDDQAGQRISMTDNYGTGQTADTYSYDANGNLLSASNDNGQTNTYAYDDGNEETCISYIATANSTCAGTPSGSYVTRAYNSAGQLSSTKDWLSNTVKYTNYNALGEVGTITYPSATGESLTYSYDADGNAVGLAYGGTNITGLSGSDAWTPNADNQVAASSNIHSYSSPADTYDSYGRVRQATNPTATGSQAGADTYMYDNDGDLLTDSSSYAQTVTNNYNGGNELTSTQNLNNPASTEYESFGYTADGQRCWSNWASATNTSACGSAPTGSTQYAWNTYGQLCWSGTSSSAVSCASSGGTSYTYDGNNVRMTATTGSTTTKFDWDSVTGGSTPLDISDGTNSYIYGPILFGGTAPIEQISASGTVSFLASTQSGVQAVFTNGSSPKLSELAAYSLWGVQSIQKGSDATPFGFQGSYTDNPTGANAAGLIYVINRYYDPTTDQFLSVDPAVAETGQPYAFTGDDPLNATDPLGLRMNPDGSESQLAIFYQGVLKNERLARLGRLGVRAPSKWTFSQKGYDEEFGAKGDFAGKTINQVAGEVGSGETSAQSVPINLVNRGGNTYILNTRSAQALTRAGVPRDEWNVQNSTGSSLWEKQLSNNLGRAGLSADGSEGGIENPLSEGPPEVPEVSVPWYEVVIQDISESGGDD